MFTLVAGTGYTGKRVLERLPDAAGLSRSPIESNKPFYRFDFDAPGPFPLVLPGNHAVLYTCPPDGGTDQRLQQFLTALPATPARFVYISTTGVYGDCRGATVTEETPVNPGSPMSLPRVAAEERLSEWAAANGTALVILRVPGIYGPGRLGLSRIEAGEAVLRESDANPGNRIHVDDLASCCIAALDERVPAGIYNVGDGDHRSATWFAEEVARQANLPEPRKISREEAALEFSPRRLAFLGASRRVDVTKMHEVLGVQPMTPEEGIRASLGL